MSQKLKIRLFFIVFISFVFVFLFFLSDDLKAKESGDNSKITACTDKTRYTSSNKIKITITNNSKEEIYSHAGSGTPLFSIKNICRKGLDGNWETLSAQCTFPECMTDSDAPKAIKPGQQVTMTWDPMIFNEGSSKLVPPGSGKYRLIILYEDYQKKNWKTIQSNIFNIK